MFWFGKMTDFATIKPEIPIRIGTTATPPWLGIINQKRIWHAINPVANNYLGVREESDGPMPKTEEFAGFIENDDRGSWEMDVNEGVYYNKGDEKGWRRIMQDSDGEAIPKKIRGQGPDSDSEETLDCWHEEWSDVDWDDTEAQGMMIVLGAA